jgi:hypothetical protein
MSPSSGEIGFGSAVAANMLEDCEEPPAAGCVSSSSRLVAMAWRNVEEMNIYGQDMNVLMVEDHHG